MRKLFIIILLAGATISAKAQTTNTGITEHDAAIKAKDTEIKVNFIDPAERDAGGQAPDWSTLADRILKKYDAIAADRTLTKAKIFFYWYKDWPMFCESLVHYTSNYELANDFPLLNKNANMILKNSNDPSQLKAAQQWAKLAMDGDTGKPEYQTTYQALSDKLAGK